MPCILSPRRAQQDEDKHDVEEEDFFPLGPTGLGPFSRTVPRCCKAKRQGSLTAASGPWRHPKWRLTPPPCAQHKCAWGPEGMVGFRPLFPSPTPSSPHPSTRPPTPTCIPTGQANPPSTHGHHDDHPGAVQAPLCVRGELQPLPNVPGLCQDPRRRQGGSLQRRYVRRYIRFHPTPPTYPSTHPIQSKNKTTGSKPSGIVNPKAIAAMKDIGYDLSTHDSKVCCSPSPPTHQPIQSKNHGDHGLRGGPTTHPPKPTPH